ncbi:MAG: hypothetical protein NTX45_06230 [Proteobacteria bacterium]|nr:hypothetical protein [Pseudomonadota bacterium]
MATLHITVPDEVKTKFEKAFSGQSLDELVTRLMSEAVEQKPVQQTVEHSANIWDFILNRPYEGKRSKEDIDAQIEAERASWAEDGDVS